MTHAARSLVRGRLRVGDLEVVALSDGVIRFDPTDFFPSSAPDRWQLETHTRWLDDEGRLALDIGCFLVRSGDSIAVIDLGLQVDDGAEWRGGRLLDALAEVGTSTADVDVVAVTHLHPDHVGWAATADDRGDPAPTFPNAAFRCHADDWAWAQQAASPELWGRVLDPVAGRVEPLADGASLAPGVTALAAPGHTPGHLVYALASRGERALLLGNLIHCPVQLSEPEWYAAADVDARMAARTRETVRKELEHGVPAGAAHFPGLKFGRIVGGGVGRTWTVMS